MYARFEAHLAKELSAIADAGLRKNERVITTTQQARIATTKRDNVLNLCANNYLGLANHPLVLNAAREGLERWGYGMASVRFICGTQQVHTDLEQAVSRFHGTDDAILYSSCFDANGGLFETILGAEDAIISDQLNHASIIDGVRLCKAKRFRYANNNMTELEDALKAASDARFRLIATDGVFSMDGTIANLPAICDLADKYDALIMVDDSHATGFYGPTGRGTPEYHGVQSRIDIITSTLGKALGGASGGFTTGRKAIIDLLRQRSRTYLFSNTLAPIIAHTTLRVLEHLSSSTVLRDKLARNTIYFRKGMSDRGFAIRQGDHPIVPIMIGDAPRAAAMAEKLLAAGIYVVSFSYPVVPLDTARIRVQVSAAHSTDDLDLAMNAFAKVQRQLLNA